MFVKIIQRYIIIIYLLLFFAFLALYASFLDVTPIYFNQDELGFSVNAYSIAQTGFDENARFLPLYFWHLGVMWSTPIVVYLPALILKFLPLSEVSVRLSSTIIAALDILLIYFLSNRVFKDNLLAILSAAILALTPAHFIHSRLLLDNLYIVPFVIGWLLLLHIYLEKKKAKYLFLAGFVLGVGIHSYHSAKVLLPMYLFFTLIILIYEFFKERRFKGILLLIAGFLIPVLPLYFWLQKYPDTLLDQVKYTRLYDSNQLSPLQGILSLLNSDFISTRMFVYISYFNPAFLFMTGDASLIHSTHMIGVFIWSLMILLPLGMFYAVKKHNNIFTWILIAGFFTAPVGGTLVGEYYRISRALVILPFATILAVYGFLFFADLKKYWRVLGIIILIAIPIQFYLFLFDYYSDYRERSASWFRYNVPGAVQTLIKKEDSYPSANLYMASDSEYFIEKYFRFYAIKNNREEFIQKAHYFDPRVERLNNLPSGSLVLLRYDDFDLLGGQEINKFVINRITELDGTTTFYILKI